ncbi:hypothetical protein N7492_006032 [Penicillium capsulatum]|uniref:Uncharacterized protein n=1 Tax=Penicillium capsulatum TaxID=69766 RepID=A0A9W9LRK9_9EURO|nr:hypothetical protein N7492_006032 [Penicillium capsulatum]KAJ6134864.1 hypothetical protein N7512_000024 [Penicillium capsulatum]
MAPRVKELTEAIKNFLRGNAGRKDLEQLVENDEDKPESKSKLPALAVSSPDRHRIESILRLQRTADDPDLRNVPPMHLPTGLRDVLRVINATVDQTDASEANIRISLNMLLIYAQYHVRLESTPSGRSLHLKPESTWSYGPAKDRGTKCNLSGKPDYAIWYGEVEGTAVNVVVVEAKKSGDSSRGVAQCLGYMGEFEIAYVLWLKSNSLEGMVHRLRKDEHRQDCTVYGMSADDENFWFLKINSNSQWLERVEHARDDGYEQVFGLLVYFLRKTSLMSPSHSKESSNQTHTKKESGGSARTIYLPEDEDVEMELACPPEN